MAKKKREAKRNLFMELAPLIGSPVDKAIHAFFLQLDEEEKNRTPEEKRERRRIKRLIERLYPSTEKHPIHYTIDGKYSFGVAAMNVTLEGQRRRKLN